jgi:ABC-type transport system involved in multi-copper enzyme maturation permease subunit
MNVTHIYNMAWKEYQENKIRILIILFTVPAISSLFFIPSLFSDYGLLEDLIQKYEAIYLKYSPVLRRQMILVDFQLPLYLLIPAFASPFFGILEGIVGEKDGRTLESLLALPVNRWEVLFGKVGLSITAAVIISWSAFVFHLVMFQILIGSQLSLHILTLKWFLVCFLLIPAIIYMISIVAILIAMRVKKVQTAVNWSMLIFTPVFILLIGIGTDQIPLSNNILIGVGSGLLFSGGILTWIVKQRFSVERLILGMYD